MKLKLIHKMINKDGELLRRTGTQILNTETGEILEGVISANFDVNSTGAILTLKIICDDAEIDCDDSYYIPSENDRKLCDIKLKKQKGVLNANS